MIDISRIDALRPDENNAESLGYRSDTVATDPTGQQVFVQVDGQYAGTGVDLRDAKSLVAQFAIGEHGEARDVLAVRDPNVSWERWTFELEEEDGEV